MFFAVFSIIETKVLCEWLIDGPFRMYNARNSTRKFEMLGLKDLSELIEKEILIAEHDVQPVYLPNLKQIRDGSTAMLDVLYHQFDEFKKVGRAKWMKKSTPVLHNLLNFVHADIKRNGRWSFWHFMSVGIVTALAHEELVKKNKHATIKLSDQATWANPDWQVATLFFYFCSAQLYKSQMIKFMELQARGDIDIETLSRYLVRKIKLINGDA